MFNSPVLDLVILLSFTYFIGSLILSAINEAIAGAFNLRQQDLRKAITTFFFSASWKTFVNHTFFQSANIQSLFRKKGVMPAYIPAKNFVQAIVEHLKAEDYKDGKITPLTKEGNAAEPSGLLFTNAALPKEMIVVLQTIMKQVGGFTGSDIIVEFEKRLEEFYNLTMDRVTGWYKRRVRRILLILGFVLSVLLNVDTIKIANDAMTDKDRLSKTVDNIAANLKNFDTTKTTSLVVSDADGTIKLKSRDSIERALVIYEKATGYQLGYKSLDEFKNQWKASFWTKLLGVLLTAFALQLGSNYWFDLINKAVNIRAAGTKPDQLRPNIKTT